MPPSMVPVSDLYDRLKDASPQPCPSIVAFCTGTGCAWKMMVTMPLSIHGPLGQGFLPFGSRRRVQHWGRNWDSMKRDNLSDVCLSIVEAVSKIISPTSIPLHRLRH